MMNAKARALELDAIDYRNGTKNNWRRRAWNAIRRDRKNTRDAVVLYLPGAQNLDRPVALERGFRPANLIAVERDKRVAEHLRREHKQAVIEGDLYEVMMSWPIAHPVDVVFADLTCAFDGRAVYLLGPWLANPAFHSSLLVVNAMRGRENSAHWREFVQPMTATMLEAQKTLDEKNRSLAMLVRIVEYCDGLFGPDLPGEWIANLAWGSFGSYRNQSGIYFDSAGFKCRYARDRTQDTIGCHPERLERRQAMRRRIIAALAVRTMRLRGNR